MWNCARTAKPGELRHGRLTDLLVFAQSPHLEGQDGVICYGSGPGNFSKCPANEYWNATAGDTWAQFQEPLDRQIEPLGLAAIDVLDPAKGEHIIDIGCGCGQTSLALAARVGPTGSVVGVDISRPMLAVASAVRCRAGL
jgi:SAM-dependent methyltransferase